MSDIKNNIEHMTKMLKIWNQEYYVNNQPSVSDNEYDQMLSQLLKLEQQYPEFAIADSPTKIVGGQLSKAFSKFEHKIKMLSLSNVFTIDEFINFNKQVSDVSHSFNYYAEIKMDGLALALIYKNGKLANAVTRGDGQIGEDITSNVRVLHAIPETVTEWVNFEEVEVRGEIFFYKHIFEKLNKEKNDANEEPFKNPRNAVAGTMRQLDSRIVAKRQPAFMAYGINDDFSKQNNFDNLSDAMNYLASCGFTIATHSSVGSLNETWDFCKKMETIRHELPFEIDGVVIKVNQIDLQPLVGYTSKSPKWATAYKFKATEVESQILNVIYQVGRTGTITPVAELEPVMIDGSLVSRATLNNKEIIEIKDLHINDYVLVRKAGEIIPEIVKAIPEKRPSNATPITFVKHCPSCGSELFDDPEEVAIRCVNENCDAKMVNKLIHFVSRNALNIDGFGAKLVEKLFDEKYISDYVSIFDLKNHKDELVKIDKLGNKSVTNLLKNIELAKEAELSKYLVGFGIRHIGQRAAYVLAQEYKNIDELFTTTIDELEALYDFGPEMVKSIVAWRQNENNIKMIADLKARGISFLEQSETTSELTGETFVITGSFEKYKREQIKQILESRGAVVASAVSKKTSCLIAGEKAGSKLKKAEELQIKIINEKELEEFLSER